ncbi:MAG: alpha/beta hydrolase [Chloroflexota bacterium]|nr:alpha/beta hydrolase [Chloroflexota bacterium]MDE2898721.1 alpha/beta hydrolase [Chloroflexota bacterium]
MAKGELTLEVDGSFAVSDERGSVSSVLLRPPAAHALLVLGHGAGTNARHPFMEQLAEALAGNGVATFRFNYPYSESGRGGMDGERVRLATVQAAVAAAKASAAELPTFAGGHSMSGRMATLAVARGMLGNLDGIVAYAFPLHQPGRPDTARAGHLKDVDVPVLLLSGDRDRMARLDLLRGVAVDAPATVCLHVLERADHGFKVLKRSGRTPQDVLVEAARVTTDWMAEQANR